MSPAAPTAEERIAYLKTQADFDPEPAPAEPEEAAAAPAKPAPAVVPAAAEPPPKPEAKPAPAHTHSKVLLRAAMEAGISEDEIGDTPSADLWQYVQGLRADRERDRERAVGTDRRVSPSAPASQSATVEPVAEPEFALDWGTDVDDLIDPEVRTRIDKAVKQALKPLQERIEQLTHFERGRQQESQFSKLDQMFADLGTSYEAVLGKGRRDDFDPSAPEMTRRAAVIQAADRIVKSQGDKPNYKAAFAQAARDLFGGIAPAAAVTPAPARSKVARAADGTFTKTAEDAVIEEWEQAAVARPTNRVQPPTRGNAAAKAEFERGLAELNARSANGVQEETEF